jgi:hypothetical protein
LPIGTAWSPSGPPREGTSESARELLGRIGILDLVPEIVTDQGLSIELASHDERTIEATRKLKIAIKAL